MTATAIERGTITAFFLFDVAEAIDLTSVGRLVRSTVSARLAPKPTAPPHVHYRRPPVVIEGGAAGVAGIDGFTIRLKVFDYGVISAALTRAIPSSWEDLLDEGQVLHDNPVLARGAEAACRTLLATIGSAVTKPRAEFLAEDYVVFAATRLGSAPTAEALLAARGDTIAQLLRGEREPLSPQERAEVLRHQISYLATDVVVPTWAAAFVYDTEEGAQGVLEILEFANSQLLEFRYYDMLLDTELAGIYVQLEGPAWLQSWFGRKYTKAARHVHALFVDVNELTDRTENALKIAGDVYAARLLALTGSRLGLDHWKTAVREKLQTADDIYRFVVEQTSMTRGEFLELAIVLILILELALFFAGIMR
jgi:hypothetical protein